MVTFTVELPAALPEAVHSTAQHLSHYEKLMHQLMKNAKKC